VLSAAAFTIRRGCAHVIHAHRPARAIADYFYFIDPKYPEQKSGFGHDAPLFPWPSFFPKRSPSFFSPHKTPTEPAENPLR